MSFTLCEYYINKEKFNNQSRRFKVLVEKPKDSAGALCTGRQSSSFYVLQMYAQKRSAFKLAILATFTHISTNLIQGNTSFSKLTFLFN